MFPANWTVYVSNAVANNENPCWVDFVGNGTFPALYYVFTDPTNIYFRMRLNGDPIKNNPNVYELEEDVWGVQVVNAQGNVLFNIRVNASGNNYQIQVYQPPAVAPIFQTNIQLHNPEQAIDNVRVLNTNDSQFNCSNNPNDTSPDDDFFLDFLVPKSVFGSFNFTNPNNLYRLCYYTATQDNNINKEYLCGDFVNPPQPGTPLLCASKTILQGPTSLCTNETATWTLQIQVRNCGTVALTNVVLTDTVNTSLQLASPIVVVPAVGPVVVGHTITWNIGNLAVGDSQVLIVTFSGNFTTCGFRYLNEGTATGTYQTQNVSVNFRDIGVTVNPSNALRVTKTIVSGPTTVEICKVATWKLRITVANISTCPITGVEVFDTINDKFALDNSVLGFSQGSIDSFPPNIHWLVGTLNPGSTATLEMDLTGFFFEGGLQVFNNGYAIGDCQDPLPFQDNGVTVRAGTFTGTINVSGRILDCDTCLPLDNVKYTLYNSSCQEIGTGTVNGIYSFNLAVGTYVIKYTKVGYGTKFLAAVLLTGGDVTHDICLTKKCTATIPHPDAEKVDIFVGIIKKKIDADVLYHDSACIYSDAVIECLDDVIDSATSMVVCDSKLRVTFTIEKNIVYKRGGVKAFTYTTKQIPICFPLEHSVKGTELQDYFRKGKVRFCKENNLITNDLVIRYVAFFLCNADVITWGEPESWTCPEGCPEG